MVDNQQPFGRPQGARAPFHVMAKPIGPLCNLDCKYCFYLEKEALFPTNERFRMPGGVLEAYVRQYIGSQDADEINFAWQGGEPTLLGIEFFRGVVELQRKFGGGRRIRNAFQTNGILLDDAWGEFLKANDFLVGLSVDGPARLHDAYRVDKRGGATFERVMRGLEVLRRHGVEFNTLTVVNRVNGGHPLEVYDFLKGIGSTFLQFIPLVERKADLSAAEAGMGLAAPPDPAGAEGDNPPVTEWSVQPTQYGKFLISVFDRWVREDVGRVFVNVFDAALANWYGADAGTCVFTHTCGSALAIEHNGDVYPCDHYVYPRLRLGNVLGGALGDMVNSTAQVKFGLDKRETLPRYCRECDARFACHGECPKHRFLKTPQGEPGLNYLCAGYKRFFRHIDPHMRAMAELLHAGRAPADVMGILAREFWKQPRSPDLES